MKNPFDMFKQMFGKNSEEVQKLHVLNEEETIVDFTSESFIDDEGVRLSAASDKAMFK